MDLYLPMILWLCTIIPIIQAVIYKLAWLAPEDVYMQTQAGSTIGALQKAIDTVESTILTSDTISVAWKDSNCDSRTAISAAYNVLVVDSFSPHMLLGPPCSSSMLYVGGYAGYNELAVMGWLSDSSTFEDKTTYNSLVRAYSPINAISDALILMLKEYDWARVELISSDSYSGLGEGIFNALSADSYFNLVRWQEVDDSPNVNKIKKYYDVVKPEARIVLLAIPQRKLRKWMRIAEDEGMTSGDYVFIYIDNEIPSRDLERTWFSKRSWKNGDDNDDNALEAFENVLVLAQSLQYVDTMHSFLSEADDAASTSSLPTSLSITTADSDVTSPFLHDAVLLWATLVNELGTAANGSAMLQQARNREFSGSDWATGTIYMDDIGDRRPEFWLLDLRSNDEFDKAVQTVNRFSAGALTTSVEIVKDVIWGDGTRGKSNAPPDIPVCGWDNEKCPNLALYIAPVAVFVFLVIVAIIIFFLIRKYRFEQSLKNMKWMIAREELQFKGDKKAMGSTFLRMSHASMQASRSSHVGHDKSEALGDDSAQQQMFIPTAKYKGAQVAIRPVRKDRIKTDRDVLVEMKQMTNMKHPNINQFIGAVVEPPKIMEVWEYCTKGGLQDVVWDENVKLDDMFKFSLATDIFKGLKYIHNSPFKYHGALRSSSCVVDGRWTCKITDYGLRRFHQGQEGDPDLTDYKKITRQFWVAPEHLRKATDNSEMPGSQPGDVYAATVIIKEIFARNEPYTEYEDIYTPEEIIEKVKSTPNPQAFRPDLREARDRIPGKLLDIIKRGWVENPEERPSASSMLKNIQRVNPSKSTNVVDNMIQMMEKYSTGLEAMVLERTQEVHDEKKRSDMLLFKMLPKSVAEDLRLGKTVAPEAFEHVSIYFSDIVSFTKLAAQSTPMQVVAMLNTLYTEFDSITEDHDVYKVETIGDAYMYVSGLPLRNGDNHAAEVTNCAMDLLTATMAFKVAHLENYTLKIRIGLHTGMVVAGVVGVTMPRYCLFGESVTTASKMESGGEPMRIHLSETTYKYLTKFKGYHLADRGLMEIKGKGSLRTYFLVSRDGYDKPYPDYHELAAEDDPKPVILPVTSGRVQRKSVPLRPSTESGFYESEAEQENNGGSPSRKTSTAAFQDPDKKLENIAEGNTPAHNTKNDSKSPKKENEGIKSTKTDTSSSKTGDKEGIKANGKAEQEKPPKANALAWRREESILDIKDSEPKVQRKKTTVTPPKLADIQMDDLEETGA